MPKKRIKKFLADKIEQKGADKDLAMDLSVFMVDTEMCHLKNIRNRIIKEDFDKHLRQKKDITFIYGLLSRDHDISVKSVRRILWGYK